MMNYQITHHAAERYQERRCRHPLFMVADLSRARPATKARLRKAGKWPSTGQRLLLTPDGFAFVAAGPVIVTCYKLREG
ncbi:hypothetical protein CGX12_11850 [Zobellella denitrificans]|uniref:hypothetical protein n=1 Tax=Zobellella denitrificans TaxID=347534 RepID=UPI000B8C4DC6|nr:hypothetical protein [Zobellella denitrificans]OXS14906.1 hypothetical protein CGX12_11850 [Zobellella denitrificans]